MKNRVSNASQQFVELFSRVVCWLWETLDKLLDIFLDFLARLIELTLAVMNLIFQVICFLRDICIDSMQTFANIFRGIVNVIANITCDEVEDFASACIVVLLWIGAFRIARNLFNRSSRVNVFRLFGQQHAANINNNNKLAAAQLGCVCPTRKRTGRRNNRRNGRRPQAKLADEELSG
ncbi:uncharacterized protein LOC128893254 [Hylaeus anthracinus]|uniref:uncharacterized protein LOC128875407 n=1 Tax=Hylaeus volcanicus TaxID=313075 RepID=UPI0023B85588|nr:uncharacterized protein LOC128875407 [Hylaeus volcanicus]XP_054010048.1 uncharacterized protein LOC128893243 [Hylaeus anthracinus]XP_054010070.1 uncharacterized protein LOC128893254 [Hylaeus anthracinus]